MIRPFDSTYNKILPLTSDEALRRRFMIIDEEIRANMRFGLLLEVLDKVAEEAALNYVNRFNPDARVVTAAIDNIVVRHVTDLTRDMHFHARINHVGRSSLEVGIRVEQPGDPGSSYRFLLFHHGGPLWCGRRSGERYPARDDIQRRDRETACR